MRICDVCTQPNDDIQPTMLALAQSETENLGPTDDISVVGGDPDVCVHCRGLIKAQEWRKLAELTNQVRTRRTRPTAHAEHAADDGAQAAAQDYSLHA